MTDAPEPQNPRSQRPLDAAHIAAEAIGAHVQHASDLPAGLPPADLSEARTAFGRLREIADLHPQTEGLMRVAVCGATRYLAIGRRIGDIGIVRDAHLFLATLSLRDEDDPLPHRALAEASVDLMLAEARQSGFPRALDTYRTVVAISLARGGDPNVACAHAKGAANLVALALEADAPLEADRALADLARLEADQPEILPVRQQRGRGLFNRVAHAARRAETGTLSAATSASQPAAVGGLTELAALIEVARRAPVDPDLVDLAAEGLFAFVTGLGTRGEVALARRHYDDLSSLAQLPEAGPPVRRRLADAAFNLITDLCESGETELATLLYGDLSGLSVVHDDDPSICLAHAKASANLVLTHRDRGDHAAANIIADDLRSLVFAHPENMELMEVATFLDLADV
ncbi:MULTISPECIES: hypothetical protein [Thalassobaculum]|uniref:Uncharacterized protein n=1 Tax=Thalassobaculum litoreum DSM 18839 TaxID=1123362 RepID=A0A8G2EWY1_9PROT|nr:MULTISPECIES: hypothetical protein [Thalassobaculum]SDG47343.1 hypothetical protein SAMN05660686_04540 [Thalassobaculum litoreum DSM 18839]